VQIERGAPAEPLAAPAPIAAALPRDIPSELVEALIRRGDSPETRRAYVGDVHTFRSWLNGRGLRWNAVTPDDLDLYREWLAARYARSTTNRRLVVVRSLYAEALRRRLVATDPAERLRSLRGRDEREGGALTRSQARAVLEAALAEVERPERRLLALRDLAILSLLIRTGLRRSELAGLRIGDLGTAQGHDVLTVRGKGNVTRTVKVPIEVRWTVGAWLDVARDQGKRTADTDFLFGAVNRGDRQAGFGAISDRAIYDVVARRLLAAGVPRLGPHGLRATFVTLALEGGASLHLVQRAAGHADPRTTEKYWRRKDALDDNAVDYIKL
jgi:site-specific recombinase XerD